MILNNLKATTSRTAKEYILKAQADTFDKQMFHYAYDSNKVYNLKYNFINWKSLKPLHDTDIVLLDRILAKEIIGNEARASIDYHCKEYGDLVKLIVNKDLDCGVTATTLNKVFGKDFIFQFKAQKAMEVPIRDVKLPTWGQIKYNGIRTIAHITKKSVMLRTFNGKVFHYPELEKELLACHSENIVLDGELCIGDSQGTNHTDVKVNASIRTGKPILGRPYVFNVFDAIPMEDFDKQYCADKYSDRFNLTKQIVSGIDSDLVVPSLTFKFASHKNIENLFDTLINDGYEGLILKHPDHYYTYRKNKNWIKIKDVKDCDLKCVDTTEGKDKYEGLIGALVCEGTVDGKKVRVNVAGLTDAMREKDPDYFIGEIVEIKYNSLIVDKDTCEWSLFLPRFSAVRYDK